MFEPQKDRADYGKMLASPDGYETDFAVGTTYSLDLDAFIGACMSLGLGEDTESELLNNPIFMLDVLHKTSDKIALFCEGGQIHSPAKVTPLYALLENSVFQVSVKGKTGAYSSFHPKFWLISYKNKNGERRYRIVVLSRNLTFDRSWDVVVCFDGYTTSETVMKNRPIKDFLIYLQNRLPTSTVGKYKNKRMRELISALDRIEFRTENKAFEDFDFIPLGVGDYSIKNYPLFGKEKYCELFAMSPFLSKTTVKELNDRWKKTTVRPVLITRRQSLNEIKGSDNFDVYCMRSDVVDGEDRLCEGNAKQQDIHAKLYMLRESFYADAELYLGSMNASHNAMFGNIEFMVRLKTKRKYLNLDMLKKELFCGDENGPQNPFEKVDTENIEIESDGDENLDDIVKVICRSNPNAEAKGNGENYDIILETNCEKSDIVTISPLFAKREEQFGGTVVFRNLTLKELSRFYKITVFGKEKTIERIIVIPTADIPENRDETIISSIVTDTKSFYAYLSFVLGDNPVLGAMEAFRVLQSGESVGKNAGRTYPAALYEKMLKVAATDPDKLNGVEYLIKAVSKDGIIPPEFVRLYETFQKAVKKR